MGACGAACDGGFIRLEVDDDDDDDDSLWWWLGGAGFCGVANSGRNDTGGGVSGGSWCSRAGRGVAGSWNTPIRYLGSSTIEWRTLIGGPSVSMIIWCVRSSDEERA